MNRLTNEQRLEANKSITPNKIVLNENIKEDDLSNFLEFSNSDYARGMLNHEKYGLTESIQTLDSDKKTAKVEVFDIDNIILTTSFKAFLESKKEKNKGDIIYSIPPYSYGFSLLLSFHLVLQHLAGSLTKINEGRFKPGTGILVLSDNIEMLSHIWRTSINKNFLRKFVNIFNIEADKFKLFNFNDSSSEKRKQNLKDDSLPWIAFYRAYRHKLPEKLEKEPQVIIIDLLPFHHRKRALNLLKWAQSKAEHVIVVGPCNDDTSLTIANRIGLSIPITYNTLEELTNTFQLNKKSLPSPISSAWSLQTSIPFIKEARKIVNINSVRGMRSFHEKVSYIYSLISKSYKKNGYQPKSFKKISSLFTKILSSPIPLNWYERTLWPSTKPTIKELINTFSKIPSEDFEEEVITHTLMPDLIDCVRDVYEDLYQMDATPRGVLLCEVLNNNLKDNKKILIIVSEKIISNELKVWLRSYMELGLDQLNKIDVVTQKEWAEKQIKEIYLEESLEPDVIILTNPWVKKYISSFYYSNKTEMNILELYNELPLLKYQINKIKDNPYGEQFKNSFYKLFGDSLNYTSVNNLIFDIKHHEYNLNELVKGNMDSSIETKNKIIERFDDQRLIKIISEGISDENINLSEIVNSTIDTQGSVFFNCVKIRIKEKFVHSVNDKYTFLPLEQKVKAKLFNEDEVKNVKPLELKSGDIWIKINKDEREELFNEVLKLSSNTLFMRWIESNISEWKDMMNVLWHKYHRSGNYKRHTQELILNEINRVGGEVKSTLTVSNWVNGNVNLVRSYKNLLAIATLLEDQKYLDRVQSIFKAMKELWGIHIALGKSLGKMASEQAGEYIGSGWLEDLGWIDLGNEIRISKNDLMDLLSFFEVEQVEAEKEYSADARIVGKVLTSKKCEEFYKGGIVKYGKQSNFKKQ
ncbi:DrmE family protein [Thalassobacillus devorans]|uniref:DrmE family protein n=1 Tax=Thalassobacillus devorans TaxID=279813 RepID=UPI00048AED48|nr:DrmE family protein [Thalassobacillus devorans]